MKLDIPELVHYLVVYLAVLASFYYVMAYAGLSLAIIITFVVFVVADMIAHKVILNE